MPKDWYGPQPGIRRGEQYGRVKVRWIERIGLTQFFRRIGGIYEVLDTVEDAEIEAFKADLARRDIHEWGSQSLYHAPGDAARFTISDAPAGSLWDADWMHGFPQWEGPDGLALIVRLPNRWDWHIDSRASNCDSKCATCGEPYHKHDIYGKVGCPKFVESRPHKCWVRHGDPKTGNLHVDKNGVTCGAGAGSILAKDYHGFLHHGYLTCG